MSETITFVTCSNAREAKRLADTFVKERLAACVNIVPGVTSVYSWKGKIRQDREVLLIIKSKTALSRRLTARVRKLHSYDCPEVVTLRITSGNPDYLRWIRESTR